MKKELCVQLVIYKDCTEMHGQQNIRKKNLDLCQLCFENLEFFIPSIKFHGNQFGYSQFFPMFAKGQNNSICAPHSKIRLTGSSPLQGQSPPLQGHFPYRVTTLAVGVVQFFSCSLNTIYEIWYVQCDT